MKKNSFVFLLFLLLISCQNEKQNSIVKENISETKKYNLPNDEFREKVLPNIQPEKKIKKNYPYS